MHALDPNNKLASLRVDATGALITAGGGGGGAGDASAANQLIHTARLDTLITQTDTLEATNTSIDTKMTTLIGHVDTLESIGTSIQTNTSNINTKLPSLLNSRMPVETLGQPGVARQLAAGAASANTALTTTCRRVSMYATEDIRYAIGSSAQTAAATSHFIAKGERLDLVVPATPNIAVIRAGATSGTLELTELV